METKSTCPYCGVGCGVIIESEGGAITGVRGDPAHPANFGKLCSKGATLHRTLSPNARALVPTMRALRPESRGDAREQTTWDTALDVAAEKFGASIREHGPDSVAFYISGQLLTEDYYVFNKLAKALIGTNNVDTNSRLCMSSAVTGYKATLGADAPPCSYEDIDHAACIFIAGANTAYAHPILFRRIEAARVRNPQLKLIVVDPRRTETASEADLFLQIQPGSDVALFNAMLHVMLRDDLVDRRYIESHTEDFDALEATIMNHAPEAVAEQVGVSAAQIVEAAHAFAKAPATLSLYCQGLNQSSHGTDKNAALINLHLACGQIGKPGAGPFSLTGQPNAMGGREVGGLANLLSAHRDLANPAHRAEVAALWGVESVPAKPGKTAVELFDALHAGEVKCVWIACTNPAQSMPHQAHVREALRRAEFVVLQECYTDTETALYADLLLPATTWGEKEGTVTNSERRISRVRAALAPPGEARHDWQIATQFAHVLAQKLDRDDGARLFPYTDAQSIFSEHVETTRGRDLDITGLSYAVLETRGPQQWPFPAGAAIGATRLYGDGVFPTATGHARFANTTFLPLAESPDASRPFRLNTGRLRDQWHGMSRTGRAAQLATHAPEPALAMHPDAMRALACAPGDLVRVHNARGEVVLPVAEDSDVARDGAFVPMHWGSRFLRGDGINALTSPSFDPVSKQPELKHAAVQIEKVLLPWRVIAMARCANADTARAMLTPLFDAFGYASCGLTGGGGGNSNSDEPAGDIVVFRAAATAPVADEVLAALDAALGINQTAVRFHDRAQGVSRSVCVSAQRLLTGFRLAGFGDSGDVALTDTLQHHLESRADPGVSGYQLLSPSADRARVRAPRSRIVCACHNVAETDIAQCLAAGNQLPQVQIKLKCGTGCGSCVPELKRMARAAGESASAPQTMQREEVAA